MKKHTPGKKHITIEEASSERLPYRTIKSIRKIILIDDTSHPKGFTIRIDEGHLEVGLWLRIPIGKTLKNVGGILTGLVALAKLIHWVVESIN